MTPCRLRLLRRFWEITCKWLQFQQKILKIEIPDKKNRLGEHSVANESLNCSPCLLRHPHLLLLCWQQLYLFAVFFVFGFKATRDVKRETSFHHPPSFSLFTSVKLSPGSVSLILQARNKNKNNNNNKINASQSLSNASYLLNFPA